jgi:hypothetical protein
LLFPPPKKFQHQHIDYSLKESVKISKSGNFGFVHNVRMSMPVQYRMGHKTQGIRTQCVIPIAAPEEFRRKRACPATVKEGPVLKADGTPSLAVIKDIRALAAKGKSLPVGSRNIRENILSKKNVQKLRGHIVL